MKAVKILAIKIVIICMRAIYAVIKICPVKDKVVFISRQTDKTPIDFTLIIGELEKRNCGWQTVVLARRIKPTVAGICAYAVHMLRQMYHLATSRVVLIDGYCIAVSVLKHKKDLQVIQIWHAIGCMKKFGYAMIGEEEGSSAEMAKVMRMHKNYNYALISSTSFIRDYIEGFNIEKEKILQIPLPKADVLTSEKYMSKKRRELEEKYPKLKNKKNILYCPTFRKNEDTSAMAIHRLIGEIDFTRYNFIYNPHPNSRALTRDQRIISLPYTTTELLSIADYVVSDYSSVIYEAGLAKKPVFLYGYDWEEYSQKRSFNLDLKKDVPVLFTDKASELIKEIEENNFDYDRFQKFIDDNVVIPEGGCTKAIVDLILGERK